MMTMAVFYLIGRLCQALPEWKLHLNMKERFAPPKAGKPEKMQVSVS
jgi:hypothetical protein